MRKYEVFQARLCQILRLHRGNPDIALQFGLNLFEFGNGCPTDQGETITEFHFTIGRAEHKGWLKIVDRQIRWTTTEEWTQRWLNFECSGGRWDEFMIFYDFPLEVDRGMLPSTQSIIYYFLQTKKCPAES